MEKEGKNALLSPFLKQRTEDFRGEKEKDDDQKR